MTRKAVNEYANKCYKCYNSCRNKSNSNNQKMKSNYQMSTSLRHNQMRLWNQKWQNGVKI